MPGKKDAAYWRDVYGEAEAAAAEAASPQIDTATGEIAQERPTGYDCGCRQGYTCLSHAIARTSTMLTPLPVMHVRAAIELLRDEAGARDGKDRHRSLAITKLEEALLWLGAEDVL
jgi:hypothetical protein